MLVGPSLLVGHLSCWLVKHRPIQPAPILHHIVCLDPWNHMNPRGMEVGWWYQHVFTWRFPYMGVPNSWRVYSLNIPLKWMVWMVTTRASPILGNHHSRECALALWLTAFQTNGLSNGSEDDSICVSKLGMETISKKLPKSNDRKQLGQLEL